MSNVLSYGFNFDRLDTVPREKVRGACFFSFTKQGMTQERLCLVTFLSGVQLDLQKLSSMATPYLQQSIWITFI